jgi:hypothetical protein
LGAFKEGDTALSGPSTGIIHRKGMVTIRLKHFRTDDNRGHAGKSGQSHGQFRVTLSTGQSTFSFPAHWNVAWCSEFNAKRFLRCLPFSSRFNEFSSEFGEASGG